MKLIDWVLEKNSYRIYFVFEVPIRLTPDINLLIMTLLSISVSLS